MQFTAQHKSEMRPDFSTHLNYIKCIENELKNVSLSVKVRHGKIPANKIKRFLRLSEATARSLRAELDLCSQTKEYTQVVAAWYPVKCYYRLYYLEAVLLYLINSNEAVFSKAGHTVVRKNMKIALAQNDINLSGSEELGKIVSWEEADSFKAVKSATTKSNYYLNTDCPYSVRAKIAEYLEHKWLEESPFDSQRGKKVKPHKQQNLYPQELCLLDYFYQMRLKFNYRESNFLDGDNVFDSDLFDFMVNYFKATDHYAHLLNENIKSLISSRSIAL